MPGANGVATGGIQVSHRPAAQKIMNQRVQKSQLRQCNPRAARPPAQGAVFLLERKPREGRSLVPWDCPYLAFLLTGKPCVVTKENVPSANPEKDRPHFPCSQKPTAEMLGHLPWGT